jgi:hypothetical protein
MNRSFDAGRYAAALMRTYLLTITVRVGVLSYNIIGGSFGR